MSTFSFPYSPALEDRSLARLESSYDLFVDGEFRPSVTGAYMDTFDPSTMVPLARVAAASAVDVDAAVAAANAALPGWAATPPSVRGRYLFRVARLIAERSRELAVLESLDGGKPIRESRDFDVPTASQHFFHYAGWAERLEFAQLSDTRPVGVCAQVIPWNFPLLMAAWKVAPALAAGNTVVLKPAETTPLTALVLASICADAGLPPGVLNVVCGAGDVGEALVTHPDVDKVAFTGSTAVGRRIATLLAGSDVRLTLELGGKSANIVFDDAALDAAVEGVVSGIFFNQGHVCCAGSRLLVAESVADEFVARLSERMGRIRVGAPLDKNTDMGAVNSPQQLARISELVDVASREGAEIRSVDLDGLDAAGCWFPPTLLLGVEPASTVARTEIFGPVLSVMTFRTPVEAVERANDSTYGLAAGVWSEKSSKLRWVSSRLRAGVVWANCYNRFDPTSPFGGFRESGFGREGGRHGLESYVGPTPRAAGLLGSVPAGRASLAHGRVVSTIPSPVPAAAGTNDRAGSAGPTDSVGATSADPPLGVSKTVKLFIGGNFVRSESAATVRVSRRGGAAVEVPSASRKDARDAVSAAVSAQPAWAARTSYNRAQILYRVAEMCVSHPLPDSDSESAALRWVSWAGWCDKLNHVLGSLNDPAGPFESVTSPVPVGVVAVAVRSGAGLLGFADAVAPAVAAGCAVVAVVDPADVELLEFAETVATSDVPAGVLNVLTSARDEVLLTLAAHSAVNALDLGGASAEVAVAAERAAAENLCRVLRPSARRDDLSRLRAVTEARTVWHPVGR